MVGVAIDVDAEIDGALTDVDADTIEAFKVLLIYVFAFVKVFCPLIDSVPARVTKEPPADVIAPSTYNLFVNEVLPDGIVEQIASPPVTVIVPLIYVLALVKVFWPEILCVDVKSTKPPPAIRLSTYNLFVNDELLDGAVEHNTSPVIFKLGIVSVPWPNGNFK